MKIVFNERGVSKQSSIGLLKCGLIKTIAAINTFIFSFFSYNEFMNLIPIYQSVFVSNAFILGSGVSTALYTNSLLNSYRKREITLFKDFFDPWIGTESNS